MTFSRQTLNLDVATLIPLRAVKDPTAYILIFRILLKLHQFQSNVSSLLLEIVSEEQIVAIFTQEILKPVAIIAVESV